VRPALEGLGTQDERNRDLLNQLDARDFIQPHSTCGKKFVNVEQPRKNADGLF
jgi:hypothetical protein